MRTPRTLLSALLLVPILAAACGGGGGAGTDTTTPPPATTEPAEPADLTQPIDFAGGEAQVEVTGDVTESFTAAVVPLAASFVPAEGDNPAEIEIDWEAANGFLFRIDFDVTDATTIDAAWAAVGVPGVSIDDENYFPDFFTTQCSGEIARFDAEGLEGSVECNDLTNQADTKTVDLQATFTATV